MYGANLFETILERIHQISLCHYFSIDRKLSRTRSYCIDKYDFYTGDGTGFTNLARLMENTSER